MAMSGSLPLAVLPTRGVYGEPVELALYIIVSLGAFFAAACMAGVFLSVATRIVTKIDVESDVATIAMAKVLAIATPIVLYALWSRAASWIVVLAGSVTAFL